MIRVLTTVEIVTPEEINFEIVDHQSDGWYLRGLPQELLDGRVMLTFEKSMDEDDYTDENDEDVEGYDESAFENDDDIIFGGGWLDE